MVYSNSREHDNPHELPRDNLEGSLDTVYHDYMHTDIPPGITEGIEKLEYVYINTFKIMRRYMKPIHR